MYQYNVNHLTSSIDVLGSPLAPNMRIGTMTPRIIEAAYSDRDGVFVSLNGDSHAINLAHVDPIHIVKGLPCIQFKYYEGKRDNKGETFGASGAYSLILSNKGFW